MQNAEGQLLLAIAALIMAIAGSIPGIVASAIAKENGKRLDRQGLKQDALSNGEGDRKIEAVINAHITSGKLLAGPALPMGITGKTTALAAGFSTPQGGNSGGNDTGN